MSKNKRLRIILSVIAISFTQGLQYTVSPVLSQIQSHFPNVEVSLIQMLISAPSLMGMIIALVAGGLVVKVSKKHLLLFSCFISGFAGFLPLLSDNFGLLLFSRVFFGVGLGLATALNTAVVADFFEGQERVHVMGIQAASIGAGMFLETTLSGIVGSHGFENVYYVHSIGFVSLILLALLLPDTGKVKVTSTERIKLNAEVFKISVLGLLEFMFLITFMTNISMHISQGMAESASVSGIVTGLFSVSQIIIGLLLGMVTRVTKKYSLQVAMLSFALGAFLLVLFPNNMIMLLIGALFCGFSQGMFVPQAMCDISNAVGQAATTMAVACLTGAFCIGQLISPTILNTASKLIFGTVTTSNVYLLSAISMTVIGVAGIVMQVGKVEKIEAL